MAARSIAMKLLTVALLTVGSGSMSYADMAKQNDLEDKISTIAQRVSEIRGLKIKKPIVKGVMNQEQLKERLLLRINEDYTKEEIAAEALTMKRFGLFPNDKNYLETIVSMLTEQIAGFYDPKVGKLYVTQSTGVGEDVVLSHEIEHAIQDQHFDLQKFMTEKKDIGDESLARQALLEGDGTLLMFEFSGTLDYSKEKKPNVDMLARSFSAASIQMAGYPMALIESMIFPYQAGLRFVDYFRSKGGWELIDNVYKKPPVSTEQILHPERYEDGDLPKPLSVNKPSVFKDWHEVSSNVTGEYSIGLMLRSWGVDRKEATAAAAGWGGDRMVLWSKDKNEKDANQTLGILKTTWDKEDDAKEFFNTAKSGLEKWSGSSSFEQHETLIKLRDPKSGQFYVLSQNGVGVLLVMGAPPAWADVLVEAI